MDVTTAIRLVENLVFFPGWELTATDHSDRFEDTICVQVTYPSYETNRPEAERGYDVANRPYARFPIVVRDLDDVGLYRAISRILVEDIWSHEVREALRVKPTFWAPFHPHQIDGMRRWEDGSAQLDASVHLRDDLQFGIA
jgi:hypothetical protein